MSDLRTIRTDVIGSLLRPAFLKDARKAFDEGKMPAEEFRAIEDKAVRQSVRMQEEAGVAVLTDGEQRRLNFQDSFGGAVEGFDAIEGSMKAYEKRVEGSKGNQRWEIPDLAKAGTAVSHRRPAARKLSLKRNIPLEEFSFVAKETKTPAKVTLIGPDRISQRFDYKNSTAVYPDMNSFLDDVIKIERQIIQGLVDAGCKYVHIDAPGFTAYVDEPSMYEMTQRGEDPMENFSRSLKAEARVVKDFPGVTFGIHLCRGNQHSMWHREGKYDGIAERLLNELPHDRIMLEYDTPRAGSFEPLRFLPKGKTVVLGLVSTKTPEMETVDGLRKRIDEASKFVPLDQIAISPQCGFASDIVGNKVSEDDQRRKLSVLAETARLVWG
jgi:5-methyltetrahydropteroyltriglutamate--homocysteine methyltransferase